MLLIGSIHYAHRQSPSNAKMYILKFSELIIIFLGTFSYAYAEIDAFTSLKSDVNSIICIFFSVKFLGTSPTPNQFSFVNVVKHFIETIHLNTVSSGVHENVY